MSVWRSGGAFIRALSAKSVSNAGFASAGLGAGFAFKVMVILSKGMVIPGLSQVTEWAGLPWLAMD
jgi:hypothetical protein